MKRSIVGLATLLAAASLGAMATQQPATVRRITPLEPVPQLRYSTGKQKAQWKRERRGRR